MTTRLSCSHAIRRAARLADGYFPGTPDLDELGGLIRDLASAAEAEGRSPDEIEINAMFGVLTDDAIGHAERLAELGVSRAMVPAFFFAGPGGLDRLGEFGEKMVRPLAT